MATAPLVPMIYTVRTVTRHLEAGVFSIPVAHGTKVLGATLGGPSLMPVLFLHCMEPKGSELTNMNVHVLIPGDELPDGCVTNQAVYNRETASHYCICWS